MKTTTSPEELHEEREVRQLAKDLLRLVAQGDEVAARDLFKNADPERALRAWAVVTRIAPASVVRIVHGCLGQLVLELALKKKR